MKKLFILMILLATLALTGCFGDDEATEEPGEDVPAAPEPTAAGSGSDGTNNGSDPGSDGYPGPLDDDGYPAPSPPTPFPPGYPAPGPVVTRDAYPGGFAVFIRPAGLQCEDPIYNNADAAIADLQEAGIEIFEVSQVERVVCEACGCPSSEQFRVSIDPADIDAALLLAWQRSYE